MTEENENVENPESVSEEEQTDASNEQDNGLSKGDSPDFKWYVAHVLSGYENRVTKTLKERILNHNMAEQFSDIIVPEETVVSNVGGKKRNIKKKFFPGYVLVKMIMNEATWHLVKDTDKITGFVGGVKGKPQPITDEEASFMLGQVQGDFKKPRSATSYSAGDSVKVIEGPFASFVGTWKPCDSNYLPPYN